MLSGGTFRMIWLRYTIKIIVTIIFILLILNFISNNKDNLNDSNLRIEEIMINPPDTIQNINGKKWLFTGDMGYLKDVNGREYLFLTARAKDMIVSGGENIYPKAIENVIYQLDGIKMCAVIGIPDDKWGEAVTALVVLKEGANISEEQIISYCGEYLASYKKPKKVLFRDDLPVSAQGKILKRKLREEFWKDKTNCRNP